jgi:hypothetical protein
MRIMMQQLRSLLPLHTAAYCRTTAHIHTVALPDSRTLQRKHCHALPSALAHTAARTLSCARTTTHCHTLPHCRRQSRTAALPHTRCRTAITTKHAAAYCSAHYAHCAYTTVPTAITHYCSCCRTAAYCRVMPHYCRTAGLSRALRAHFRRSRGSGLPPPLAAAIWPLGGVRLLPPFS